VTLSTTINLRETLLQSNQQVQRSSFESNSSYNSVLKNNPKTQKNGKKKVDSQILRRKVMNDSQITKYITKILERF